MTSSMHVPVAGRQPAAHSGLGLWSMVALAAFVPWMVGAMFLMPGGDQPFGESIEGTEWFAWAGMSFVTVLPLVLSAALGWLGVRRREGGLAWVGAVLGTLLTVWFGVLPAFGWIA